MLDDEYLKSFERMVARAACAKSTCLSAFWPVVGRRYDHSDHRLLVVGRATNGWGGHGLDTNGARSFSQVGDEGPLLDPSYNVRRSAFWSVAREALEHLGVRASGGDRDPSGWMQALAWTNLFKVAPASGGNPDAETRDLVREECVRLLRLEVAQLNPRVVLVLTGADWFVAFGEGLRLELCGPAGGYVVGIGRGLGARWVVAKHPMGKPRGPFMDEMRRALAST